MEWHRTIRGDILLRLAGAVSLIASAMLWRWLFEAPRVADALAYLFALLAFASLSAGSAMLVVGAHLFDRIALSSRWMRRF